MTDEKIAIEYRVYYDSLGKIITFTNEKLEGDYLIITPEQYQECRHDAIVIDNQLIYTHTKRHVTKLAKNIIDGTKCSKYDVSVIINDEDDSDEYCYYSVKASEIKR